MEDRKEKDREGKGRKRVCRKEVMKEGRKEGREEEKK